MDETINFRPLEELPSTFPLKERQQAVFSQLRPGESLAVTEAFFEHEGCHGIIAALGDFLPEPDFPHAIVFDAISGNFVVTRLATHSDIFDLLTFDAVSAAPVNSSSQES